MGLVTDDPSPKSAPTSTVTELTRIERRTEPPAPASERRPSRALSTVGDIEMVRERTRGWIALAVIGLLALVVLSGVIGLASGKLSVNDVKELITSQTALTALVGTAMGFYFGQTMK
jgi:hypothetical protein